MSPALYCVPALYAGYLPPSPPPLPPLPPPSPPPASFAFTTTVCFAVLDSLPSLTVTENVNDWSFASSGAVKLSVAPAGFASMPLGTLHLKLSLSPSGSVDFSADSVTAWPASTVAGPPSRATGGRFSPGGGSTAASACAVTTTCAASFRPAGSVTVTRNVYFVSCLTDGTSTLAFALAAWASFSGSPPTCSHLKLSLSPSGSRDFDASSVTVCGPVTVMSAPAFAIGGWFSEPPPPSSPWPRPLCIAFRMSPLSASISHENRPPS